MNNNYIKPRIRKSFSDRTGLAKVGDVIQIDDFSADTRIFLQNKLLKVIDTHIDNNTYNLDESDFMSMIAYKAFNLEADSRKHYTKDYIYNTISSVFKEGSYYEILDLIEFFSNEISFYMDGQLFDKQQYCHYFNIYFEEEFVGYRFVDGIIIQSIDKVVNDSIENASSTKLEIVNKHIIKAVTYLSSKNKDPENSIKESVSAVEYLCNAIAKTKSFELSKSIDALDKKKKLHPCMKSMIEKMYAFASDEEGIRHSTKDGITKVSFDDAFLS